MLDEPRTNGFSRIGLSLLVPPLSVEIADAIIKIRGAKIMLTKLNQRREGFTLVEIMIVFAIIALLAAVAVPGFLRARKRSQASRVVNDLRLIDAAVD